MPDFSVVILAAGESSRLGRPKQLVEIDGVPLIRRAVDAALAAKPLEVIVVLGACLQEVAAGVGETELAATTSCLHTVVNPDWREGMGSSIRAGVQALNPSSEAVVLMLCDQPYVAGGLLRSLVEALTGPDAISATTYDGLGGAPCAFGREMFAELSRLSGDKGARELIRDPKRSVALVACEAARIDIDTPEDLQGRSEA